MMFHSKQYSVFTRKEIYVVTLPPPMIQCAERCLLSMESEKARVKICCIVLNNIYNNSKTIKKTN